MLKKETHVCVINYCLTKEARMYHGVKTVCTVSGAGKIGQKQFYSYTDLKCLFLRFIGLTSVLISFLETFNAKV